ncbi:reticulocyte binding protein, putative, partial [Plasmodium berghei]
MEAYMEDLDNIKKKSEEIEKDMKIKMDINKEMEVLKITHDDDKNYHTISKNHEKSISDIRDKSSKIIQDFSKESDINNIKNELQKNISESQKHNSDINQYLSKIENIYNILKLNKIQKIIDKVKEYNDEIEKNNKKINDELSNSKTLIKKLEEDLNLKECQSKIKSTIDDNYVGECIKNITGLKTYILNEENNINTYFKNAEEYNKIVLLNFNNIEMADTKSQYILNIKTNNGTNIHDYNITELKKHKDKSNGYKEESDQNTKAIKQNKELFEKYKQDVTILLNKYYAVELKNKFDKTKKDSEQIIKEIKDAHNNCISQSDKSEQKMNEIKNEQIHIEDEVANNDKSNKAILNIQLSVDPFETKFLKIKDIRTKSDDCLKETENIEKQISTLSIDSQETKLKENGDKLNTLEKLFESLKNPKKNIEDQKKELDEVNSKIEKIESDVNQHKKNYEIGIVEKINEIAKANKEQIESTKKLIEPTIKNLISSFNTNDLEGIDTNENLEKYNKEMNNIYEEYIKSYNLITDYLETLSKEPITYDQIKNTRITAQKLKKHKDKSNGYKEESDQNTKAIKQNKELFEKYKQDVTILLNKYYAVELKNKFDKTKKDSEQIIKEIKDAHNNCISQSDKSEQKMNEIKNEQIHIEDEVANNDKSNKAITDIKISVEPFETKFLKINDIRKKSDGCLKETENIEKQISNLSIDSQETKLKENGDKLNTLEKLFESLKNQKKNIEDQKKELDEVNSKIEKIESDVNQHKKNYEIGIVEKINEITKENKNQIESTKELIKPTIENLISSFNTNDLEGIDTNENLEKYNKEMNNIYEEFIKSYNLITNYLETVSKEPITYDQIK